MFITELLRPVQDVEKNALIAFHDRQVIELGALVKDFSKQQRNDLYARYADKTEPLRVMSNCLYWHRVKIYFTVAWAVLSAGYVLNWETIKTDGTLAVLGFIGLFIWCVLLGMLGLFE